MTRLGHGGERRELVGSGLVEDIWERHSWWRGGTDCGLWHCDLPSVTVSLTFNIHEVPFDKVQHGSTGSTGSGKLGNKAPTPPLPPHDGPDFSCVDSDGS